MIGNSPLVPVILRQWMFRDDLQPSWLAVLLAYLGLCTEVLAPLLAVGMLESRSSGQELVVWGSQLRLLGLSGCVGVHGFILLCFPLGSLMEWNAFNLLSSLFLYHYLPARYSYAVSDTLPTSVPPALLAFLIGSLYVLPFIGLFKPHIAWYAFLLQQYTGNWPAKHCLIRKTALEKINIMFPLIGVPTIIQDDSGDSDNDATHYREVVFEALDHRRHLNQRALRLALRSVFPDDARKMSSEYMVLDARSILGTMHGDTTMLTDALLRHIAEACAFQRGDLLVLDVHSFATCGFGRHHEALWRVRDAAADATLNVMTGIARADKLWRDEE